VTPDNKIYFKKSKCAGLAHEIGFVHTKFVELAEAGKRCNTVVHLPKRVS
jgi:hypothetical protein